MNIKLKLFGVPKIIVDNEAVEFPFKKAEAIFFYLAIQKRVTRDELVNLFWSELKEETAKKNLRNALYQIKKTLGEDVLYTPKRSIVELSKDITLELDVSKLLDKSDLEIYTGPFLQGYNVKNAENFEDWIMNYREYCRERFTEMAYDQVEEGRSGNLNDVIHTMQIVIKVDPYDERAYRLIMQAYADSGHTNKAFKIFQSLKSLLNEDLGVEPDVETKRVFERLAMQREEEPEQKPVIQMYGRKQEMNQLLKVVNNFQSNLKFKSVLVEGEAGIGKTTLKQSFVDQLQKERLNIIQAVCYQSESHFYLKPWHSVMEQLLELSMKEGIQWPTSWKRELVRVFPSFATAFEELSDTDLSQRDELSQSLQVHLLEDIIQGLFDMLSAKGKIILIIDDIQWMDEMSLSILTNLLLQYGRDKILFIGLSRSGASNKVRRMKATLLRGGNVDVVYLSRFSMSDIKGFLEKVEPNLSDDAILKNIFEQTEGNPFFIKEYVYALKTSDDENMTPAMRSIIEGRFNDLSEESSKLLDLVACFTDKIEFEALGAVSGKDELLLLESLEELQDKNILVEGDQQGQYVFSHHKLREYIYDNMNNTKRKILHLKVGDWFALHSAEKGYERAIYHYRKAEEHIKAMKYHLIYIESFLNFEHELYPVIDMNMETKTLRLVDNNRVITWFKEAEEELNELKSSNKNPKDVDRLIMRLLLMQGRYYIREGQYEAGRHAIDEIIQLADIYSDYDFMLKGIRQLINYAVQTYDELLMNSWINKALDILKVYEDHEEEAMIKRLRGLALIMMHRYAEAEVELKDAIKIFKSIDDRRGRYRLNIAACHNYLGDLHRMQRRFEDAMRSYELAIEISELSGVSRCTSIFLTNAGQTAYDSGKQDEARAFFDEAIRQFEVYGTVWKRSIAEGYMALIKLENNRLDEAYAHLELSSMYSNKLMNPYSIGIFNKVRAEFKRMALDKDIKEIPEILSLEPEAYLQMAYGYFKKSSSEFEMNIL